MRIGDLELQLASNNVEFGSAAAELESTKRRFRLAQDADNVIQEQDQSQGPQLRDVEGARVAAEVAWAGAQSSIQLPTSSDPAFMGKVAQLTGVKDSLQTKSLECVKSAS